MVSTLIQKKSRAQRVIELLDREYPEARCALLADGPYQLLIATMLSAQCTDERVNKVTPALFAKAPTAEAMLRLGLEQIESYIKSINFFRTKAQNVFKTSKILEEQHNGEVPASVDTLTTFPGVGRKTANVVLGNSFGIPAMVVDTHVKRLCHLLKLVPTSHSSPEEIEKDLELLVPKNHWINFSHWLILHGRSTCIARRPKCFACVLKKICPSALPN